MEINYFIVGLVGLAVLILLFWLIRRNRKDRKQLERKLNLSDLEPEKHRDEEV
ncbi:FeoB-associated Cys-rich membrane protein [Parapedobacter lycopersici]|uniref:FeoB-associated Cys-rich membrane protein n=1 Tax=Parapedobacter lycopersici TaxID=1864939 RepID=UPI00214D5347|nr:FeoB-associated Cys-rich membrane protein [Parapedobacter lycopersici]